MDEMFETKNIFLSNKKMDFEVSIEWNQDEFKIDKGEWKNFDEFCDGDDYYKFRTSFNASLKLHPYYNREVGICQDKTKLYLDK